MTSAGPDVSLGQMFLTHAARVPDRPAYRVNVAGALVEVSYSDARRRVESVAAGLLTIPGGLPAGAAVGIFANTRVEWLLSDFAALCVGAITVPVYASLLAPEVGYIHVDAAIEVCIVEGKAQLDKVRAIRDGFSFLEQRYTKDQIKLRHIVVMDPAGIEPAADWESFAALEERGRNQLGATSALRAERLATTKRDDVATYTYTSGTTGAPKGVIQTHGNWLSTLEIAADLGIFTDRTRISGVFLFLPLAHAFGRMMGFGGPFFDAVVVLASVDTLLDDLARSRPGFVPSSPRMYEKMYAKIMSGVAGAPKHRQALFNWALDCGKRTLPYRQRGRRLPPLLAAEHKLADRLVLSQIRARLGLDRCDVMLTGASPIARAVHEFFMASGLTLIEAYGMTETTPGISANVPGKWKLGTVGPLLRHVKLKFDVDGEICVKGPSITRGYLNRPDANADAFDWDGWLHTGDIGEMDAEGFLRITDRKKDLIKTLSLIHI